MTLSSHTYEHLLERFVSWASAQPDIGTALVIGSQARTTRPADAWSDLDLVVTVTTPERYLTDADWLNAIGNPCITFVERTGNDSERRVLFEGGLDVDFVLLSRRKLQLLTRVLRLRRQFPSVFGLLPKPAAHQITQGIATFANVVRRGTRVLIDKDGIVEQLLLVTAESLSPHPPTQDAFLNLINDFWYHAVWTAKKLRRGELWTAKGCSDVYMKGQLLQVIEWHACTTQGWAHDTWHAGRFLEQWADSRVVRELYGVFAYYDENDLWRGLAATMDLFRWVAVETAAHLTYPYPTAVDEHATQLVQLLCSEADR
jgi:aminoglycoside 6-adenylyltransferase